MTNKALTIEERVELHSALAATKLIYKINNIDIKNFNKIQEIEKAETDEAEKFLKAEKKNNPLIEINTIRVSKELNKKTLESEAVDNILTRYMICGCSSSSNKIYVSIGFSRNAYFGVDFYRSIQDSGAFAESSTYHQQKSNYINKSVFKHGSRIPLRYFKRCLADGFNIIFTGFEFGAAVAAFVAIRLLLFEKDDLNQDINQDINMEAMKRVRFIGFGCPLFVGEEFKKEIEKYKLSDQFMFYRNENDINVNFRDLQSILSISTHEWDLKVRDQNFDPVDLRAMSEGFREIFSFQRSELWNSTSVYFDKGYSKDNKLFRLYLPSLKNVALLIDNFKSDRFYVGFGQHFQVSGANIQHTFSNDFLKENIRNLIKNHATIQEVPIQNYILSNYKIADTYKNANSDDTNKKLIELSGENLADKPVGFLELVEKVKKYYEGMDDNTIYYTLNIAKRNDNNLCDVKVGVTHRYIDNIFCLFLKYVKNNGENDEVIRVPSTIISNDKYSIWFQFVIQIENNQNNEITIRGLEFEFNSYFDQKLTKNTTIKYQQKDNVRDKKSLIDTLGVDLIYINAIFFYYIFKIIAKEDTSNENNKGRAEKILKSLKQIEDSNTLTRSFSMDTNERIYIKAMFKLFGEDVDENFLRRFHWIRASAKTFESILKSVEQIKKNSNSSNPDPMRVLLEEMVPKVYYYKRSELYNYNDLLARYLCFDVWSYYKKYSDTIKETDFGRNIWFFKVDVEGDLFYEFKTKDIYAYYYKLNKANEKNEKNEKNDVYVSVGEIEQFFREVLNRYPNRTENSNQPDIKKEFNINDIRLMNTMKCNCEIREELAKSYMVGVIGLKKAGKSKFVELLTQSTTRIASAIDETSQMRPYEYSDELTIVDYPHYNSTNELYRVQYTYSRFLLDYVFVVIDAMQIGDSLTIDIYNLLRDLRKQNCPRFCLLLNKADNLWNDDINTKERVTEFLKKKTNVITESLKEINNSVQDGFNFNNESNCIIRLSSLFNNLTKEENGNMEKAGIITSINFKVEMIKLLNDKIKPTNSFKTIEKTSNKSFKQKNCLFKYERRKDVVLRVEVVLTTEEKVKDENDVNSLGGLKELLTDYGFYDDNSKIFEESKSNPNPKEMTDFNDFFESSEKTFVIKKNQS